MSSKKSLNGLTISSLPRRRWNVLDLITFVSRESVPTYLFSDIDMSWAEAVRKKYAERGVRVTITALLLKAIAVAQRSHPETRTASLPFGQFVTFDEVVAGFTVEKLVDNRPAVFIGLIDQPESKSIEEIVDELDRFSHCDVLTHPQLNTQVRFSQMNWLLRRLILSAGLLVPWIRLKIMGATFGLSSLGKYGIRAVSGPCVSTTTFGIGAVEDRPVACYGKVEIHPMMTISLSFDHRMLDGADAARFLREVGALMEGGLASLLLPRQSDEQKPVTINP
ncbi:MAG: 2-oxo acid dehydrogenase subunit E2 [Cyanobacteria bacterium]|nr:2-oxo acid dehydrogenase subunit E2 [Cyanobacteriota bacterium]